MVAAMRAVFAMLLVLIMGCEALRGAPPGPATGTDVAKSATQSATSQTATTVVSASAVPTDAGPTAPVASSSAVATVDDPVLLAPDGGALPQTEDEPSVDDPWFQQQLALLWEAIVQDEPERARSLFFPVVAYEQVKAIKEPAKDWKYRLWKNFVRDVHEYHKRLGKGRDGAKLVRLELRNEPAWMKPGKEGNLLGYWRVTRSYLHFEWADGKKSRFDLTSMISWRGKWYVVHLHGFS